METAQTDNKGKQIHAKRERKSGSSDSQEVGIEAAILKRKRNSSLVERLGADNITGLKHATEVTES